MASVKSMIGDTLNLIKKNVIKLIGGGILLATAVIWFVHFGESGKSLSLSFLAAPIAIGVLFLFADSLEQLEIAGVLKFSLREAIKQAEILNARQKQLLLLQSLQIIKNGLHDAWMVSEAQEYKTFIEKCRGLLDDRNETLEKSKAIDKRNIATLFDLSLCAKLLIASQDMKGGPIKPIWNTFHRIKSDANKISQDIRLADFKLVGILNDFLAYGEIKNILENVCDTILNSLQKEEFREVSDTDDAKKFLQAIKGILGAIDNPKPLDVINSTLPLIVLKD